MRQRGTTIAVLVAACVIGVGIAMPATAPARNLLSGFAAPEYSNPTSSVRQQWLDETADHNAEIARISVSWANIAPTRPGDPTNPNSAAYRWGGPDAIINDAASTPGVRILLTVTKAPSWAEGAGRPSSLDASSSWKPSAGEFGKFAEALATRYAGKIDYYQAWNEPNMQKFLAPQWQGGKAFSPVRYRKMLTQFYNGVKQGDSTAKVVGGGPAPYGDPPGGSRMRPVTFLAKMFCLKGKRMRPGHCSSPPKLNILAVNAINHDRPARHAEDKRDISTNDLRRAKRVLRKAKRADTLRPARKKPLWVTEFWWETNPPDNNGVSLRKHARWVQQALYLFWKQHAQAGIMFEIRDADCGSNCSSRPNNFQTGIFCRGGNPGCGATDSPKPAAKAFNFPFVADRKSGRRVLLWGKSPLSGTVDIERRKDGNWQTIDSVSDARAGQVFTTNVRLRRAAKLRATIGADTSLAWNVPG
jgi:hypothetical protein